MKKRILFLFILFCFTIPRIEALTYKGCDYSIISKLKGIVSNINLSYTYRIENNNAYFNVTINNIVPDLYFKDTTTNKIYSYNDAYNGEITIYDYTLSGSYKFYSFQCEDVFLGSKYFTFPKFNYYSTDPLCEDISNFSLCQKWGSVNLTRKEFEKKVDEYKNPKKEEVYVKEEVYQKNFFDKLVDIYINYYYYLLSGIIIICIVIIIVKNRTSMFKL